MQNISNGSSELGLETINSPEFDISIFEIINGSINLTKICQHFGKNINEWKRLPTTKAYLEALEGDMGFSPITAHKGNNGLEQGTFGTREVAIELARWISPKFAVWANKQIDTLLQKGQVSLQAQAQPQPKTQAEMFLQSAQLMVELENKVNHIDSRLGDVEHRQETILELQSKVKEKTPRARLNQLVREYADNKGVQHQAVWNRLYQELYYREGTSVKTKAFNKKVKPLDIVEQENLLDAAISIMYILAEENN